MKLRYHKNFLKSFKLRIEPKVALSKRLSSRLKLFMEDSTDPILKDHRLRGEKSEYRSFSVTGDIRVVYKIVKDEIWLYDVGSHNQVY